MTMPGLPRAARRRGHPSRRAGADRGAVLTRQFRRRLAHAYWRIFKPPRQGTPALAGFDRFLQRPAREMSRRWDRPPGSRRCCPEASGPGCCGWTLAILSPSPCRQPGAFNWIVDTTVVKLGTLFAEKQILFDRYRGLEALMREVSLAETLARSPTIVEWAQDENDPAKRARGIAELEHYRQAFTDKSYFFVVDGSGNYYFNDRDNAYEGNAAPLHARSATIRATAGTTRPSPLGTGCHLNVDHDDNLARHQGVDQLRHPSSGEQCPRHHRHRHRPHQLHPRGRRHPADRRAERCSSTAAARCRRIATRSMVDFHSLTKDAKAKKTIFALIDEPGRPRRARGDDGRGRRRRRSSVAARASCRSAAASCWSASAISTGSAGSTSR